MFLFFYDLNTEFISREKIFVDSKQDLIFKYQALLSTTFTPPYEIIDASILTEAGDDIVTEDSLYTLNWGVYSGEKGFSQLGEIERLATKINNLLKGFDGFEKWLYKTEDLLAFPKQNYLAPNGVHIEF